MNTLETLNNTSPEQFMEIVGGIFEHSPWIAEKAEKAKPYLSLEHLFQEMVIVVETSSLEQKLSLIKAHPNLGEKVSMTTESTTEQKGAGLQDLTPKEYDTILDLNKRYMEKFNFPFILAVRGKNKDQICEAMKTRLQNDKVREFQTALEEIYKIARFRLEDKLSDLSITKNKPFFL
ncbi:OHCU decarboxylase [Bacillus sp. SA1-12]|uniref:2-oxo-4-hydroxy-4-carboxy-5-ureidoimidazoline decarboxylase n=1 Tax=Bacillus sp. SA1-12 TaxID=1455638 RepID=UPI00062738F5|nr:2-oxo-4-hydroxy-4-carboxy-5-ureidoimidazoline decarboxylase [Bacillus sp. SA1-12]KKI90444.1 OHCU decarboxylase [Bacillus sp. SA1-12]